MIPNGSSDINANSPWLHPMGNIYLKGGLKGMVRQFSDQQGNTLVPKRFPTAERMRYTYVRNYSG